MQRARTRVFGLLIISITLPGCPALDWDFEGAGGGAGNGGEAGSGGGGVGGQGEGGGNTEDCVNGVDDDADAKADCMDDECGLLYECAPAVPIGWAPVWALEGQYADPALPATCPDGQTPVTLYAEPASTSTCGPCGCSFSGATCSSPTFICDYNEVGCPQVNHQYQSATTSCHNLPNVPAMGGFTGSCMITANPAVVAYGSCSGEPSAMMGPAMWGKELRLCPAPPGAGSGCQAGDACAQKKPAVLQQAFTCVTQAGAATCPLGWEKTNISAFEGGTDERGCSTCGCDTTSITCSGGKVNLYGENECQFIKLTLEAVGQCDPIKMDLSSGSADFVLGTPSIGTCNPAQPTGSVVTTGPYTLCCR
jgi:hypothetical protein